MFLFFLKFMALGLLQLTSICFCFLLCSSISSLVVLFSFSCSPCSSVSMLLKALSASPSCKAHTHKEIKKSRSQTSQVDHTTEIRN